MVTTGGANTHVIAVNGNFDDAQTGVKRIFPDRAFAETMDAQGRVLSSANSINFGRLVPQVVYYFSAYADLLKAGAIKLGDEVNFCVPTGNFGDILAADYAGKAGLPVGRLICASNENNVLTDFINTGVYDIENRPFYKTITPSMDILVSSNLERLLFDLSGCDGARIARFMGDLAAKNAMQIDDAMKAGMQARYWAGCVAKDGVREEIAKTWAENHYLMDPHTAVASAVLRAYQRETGDTRRASSSPRQARINSARPFWARSQVRMPARDRMTLPAAVSLPNRRARKSLNRFAFCRPCRFAIRRYARRTAWNRLSSMR